MLESRRLLTTCSTAALLMFSCEGVSYAQTPAAAETPAPAATPAPTAAPSSDSGQLPTITVVKPRQTQIRRPPPRTHVVTAPRGNAPVASPAPSREQVQAAQDRQIVEQTQKFDQRRDDVLLPKTGTTNYQLSQRDLENLPQGNAAQLSDIVLQFPGVSQDSTSSGDFHIRNEHANVQYRINGILLPDGVSGFSQVLETSFIGNIQLLTGALPAQYGLCTAGGLETTH